MRNYEFERKITENTIQKIEQIIFEFNKVIIIFSNLLNGKRKQLAINDVVSLSIIPDDNETTDIMSYETLIGYDYKKEEDLYIHCLKTDNYEIIIRSYRQPELINM